MVLSIDHDVLYSTKLRQGKTLANSNEFTKAIVLCQIILQNFYKNSDYGKLDNYYLASFTTHTIVPPWWIKTDHTNEITLGVFTTVTFPVVWLCELMCKSHTRCHTTSHLMLISIYTEVILFHANFVWYHKWSCVWKWNYNWAVPYIHILCNLIHKSLSYLI